MTGKILLLFFIFSLLSFSPPPGPSVPSPSVFRLRYNHPGLLVDLGVGLWANPIPVDWDNDGDNDLLVTGRDKPSGGMYYFENPGDNTFGKGVKIAEGKRNLTVSWPGNKLTVCTPGIVYRNFRNDLFNKPEKINYKQEFYSGRTSQWKFEDYDDDGLYDLIIGASDWRDYGWDNAYNEKGEWLHGPLHGYVYWVRNIGSNTHPRYARAQRILAAGKPVDVFGKPSPNLVDWDGDGDLDLLCGEFLDRITSFENTGSSSNPVYAQGRFLQVNGQTLHLELEMPEVVVYDWDNDSDPDILAGMEDGRVVFVENKGPGKDGVPMLASPVYFKQQAQYVMCGVLSTPCSFDWDGDGDEDILSGNSAGFIEYFENLGGGDKPKWAAPVRLKAGDKVFRIMAGKNLSIQGPAEAKWGYTVPYVADWNMDGLPDILYNSITGKIEWLPNIGTRTHPRLGKARAVRVDWQGKPPKPAWTWWNPGPNELVTQWRTRPVIMDLNKDGLNDLVVIDHEGYLSYFERKKANGSLILKPGKRIFFDDKGAPLRLNDRKAGHSGRRKTDLVDWDGDGDLDLLVNTVNIGLYRNTGSDNHFVFKYVGNLSDMILGGHSTCPTTVDWNKDGIPDLLIGAEDGFFYYLPRTSWQDMQTPVKVKK